MFPRKDSRESYRYIVLSRNQKHKFPVLIPRRQTAHYVQSDGLRIHLIAPVQKCENQVPDIVLQSFLQGLMTTPNKDKSNFSSNPLLCDSYFYLRDKYPHSPITSENDIFLSLSFYFLSERQ